jgi:hypothetical protein
MEKRFKYHILPFENKIDSHKIYLQVLLSGGFWDTIAECKAGEYKEETWDSEISERLEKGFTVRLYAEIIERRTTVTQIFSEVK